MDAKKGSTRAKVSQGGFLRQKHIQKQTTMSIQKKNIINVDINRFMYINILCN